MRRTRGGLRPVDVQGSEAQTLTMCRSKSAKESVVARVGCKARNSHEPSNEDQATARFGGRCDFVSQRQNRYLKPRLVLLTVSRLLPVSLSGCSSNCSTVDQLELIVYSSPTP